MMESDKVFDRMLSFAKIMATGRATIPKELQNEGDCLAITMQAMSWRMNPISVAQKVHFINGKIGYEAQLVAAAITNSNAVKDAFHFEWFGPWEKVVGKFAVKTGDKGEYRVPAWKLADEEGIGIKVWATLKGEDEPRHIDLLLAQARTRNSTMWADDPKQQLAYLAQKKWARLYAPGVILGVYTPDEIEDVREEKEINPREDKRPRSGAEVASKAAAGAVIDQGQEDHRNALIARLDTAASEGLEAFNAEWVEIRKNNKDDIYLVGEAEYARLLGIAQSNTQPV